MGKLSFKCFFGRKTGTVVACRFLMAAWVCSSLFLLSGCTPEDAAAARMAATALRNNLDNALEQHSALIIKARLEEPPLREDIFKSIISQDKDNANKPNWYPDLKRLRNTLAVSNPSDKARESFDKATKDISDQMKLIEKMAVDYEAAWPLGSQQFVCIKQEIFKLTKTLRSVAVSFDPNDSNSSRFERYEVPIRTLSDRYVAALKSGDTIAATASLQSLQEMLQQETQANRNVQAAYVLAAQSAADIYTAIEATETVSLADVLKLVQRYAPLLSRLDPALDGAAIAARSGVALGRVSESNWLNRFATQPIPNIQVTCKP